MNKPMTTALSLEAIYDLAHKVKLGNIILFGFGAFTIAIHYRDSL